MLCNIKKIEPSEEKKEGVPIDFAWVLYVGLKKFGMQEREVYAMKMGKWLDLFEIHKKMYNFETTKRLYKETEEEEKQGSVMDL